MKQSNNCRKNNNEAGPTENKSTNKNRKKVKVQQKESKKNECSDDDFLPSGNKLPKSGQKQLPKSPPTAQVSPATKKASQDKPNTSEQQKYPEFIPTFEFQELQSWQREYSCSSSLKLDIFNFIYFKFEYLVAYLLF